MHTIEIWLRGTDEATSQPLELAVAPPAWTDGDVEAVIKDMLRALDRAKHPGEAERPVFLRGFSWIVSPSKEGGVVIAIEMQVGAVIAGPFDIGQRDLHDMVARLMERGAATGYRM